MKGYTTNFVPKSSHVNTKGIPASAAHSVSNFIHGQTVVFANTNISQLQGQPISQTLATQINQGLLFDKFVGHVTQTMITSLNVRIALLVGAKIAS